MDASNNVAIFMMSKEGKGRLRGKEKGARDKRGGGGARRVEREA